MTQEKVGLSNAIRLTATAAALALLWLAAPWAWADAGKNLPSQSEAAVQKFMQGESVFIENKGQWADAEIKYALNGMGANVGLTDNGPRFQLFRLNRQAASAPAMPKRPHSAEEISEQEPQQTQMLEFRAVFHGAKRVNPTGRGKAEQTFNYLVGEVSRQRQNVPSFSAIWYEGLYKGIDLELKGRRTGLKYNFFVAPGANPGDIRIQYDGVEKLSITPDGSLKIDLGENWPAITDGAPYLYQEIGENKVSVAGRYRLIDERTYGFEVLGEYDKSMPLVIDPEVEWGTYLGGTNDDFGQGIAVDDSGNVYTTGYTKSSGWVSGGWDTSSEGNSDGYVVKFSSEGAHLWSTYIGGTQDEYGYGIAVDGSGNVYAAGQTSSPGWVSGGGDTLFSGGTDGYIVKLNSAGNHLWSTYFGWDYDPDYYISVEERCYGIALDANGNVYATGSSCVGGDWDAFVVKLSPSGAYFWSRYLGGNREDLGYGIAVDCSGNVYATGKTSSAGWVSGGWNTSYGGGNAYGGSDAYVVKFSSAGAHLWSTYLGGVGFEYGYGIAVDDDEGVYATGSTGTIGWVSGGWNTILRPPNGGYVVKLSLEGAHIWSTFLDGAGIDRGKGIAVDRHGDVYTTGITGSPEWINGDWKTGQDGGTNGFIVKLSSTGGFLWSSLLGGVGKNEGSAVAVDGSGNIYLTGSTNFEGWLSGGWDNTYNGNSDSFVLKMRDTTTGSLQVLLTPAAAVEAGAQWRRLGTSVWHNSGVKETNVPTGEWPLEFKHVLGWVEPSKKITVRSGGTDLSFAAYTGIQADFFWGTYLGGTSDDFGADITVDGNGDVYATGLTYSSGWVSGGNSNFDGSGAYIVKMSSSGSHLWSTYLGGGPNVGYGITVDDSGNVYATGNTYTAGWVSGGWDTNYGGGGDSYLVKLSSTGAHLWSTYLGGTSTEYGYDVTVDGPGNIYVTGYTNSSSWVSGGWDTTLDGGDGFVVKLNAAGAHLWSTYLGGIMADWCSGIAVDGSGNIYASGSTYSSDWINNGWDTILSGSEDGFLVKLSSAGAYLWSTYLGGDENDDSSGIAVDGSGNVYVTGSTSSPDWVSGGWDTIMGWLNDAYVAKFDPAGEALWSTYLGGYGGSAGEHGNGIAVDGHGNVYATGYTDSLGWISNGNDISQNGFEDAYVVKLGSTGSHLWSTYLGGISSDLGYGIAVDGSGNLYVTGFTASTGWLDGGWDVSHNGELDAFVIKIGVCHSVTYTAGNGGKVTGYTTQQIPDGGDATQVIAVPNREYFFVRWSDNSTDNPRADSNVRDSINVMAEFELNPNATRKWEEYR